MDWSAEGASRTEACLFHICSGMWIYLFLLIPSSKKCSCLTYWNVMHITQLCTLFPWSFLLHYIRWIWSAAESLETIANKAFFPLKVFPWQPLTSWQVPLSYFSMRFSVTDGTVNYQLFCPQKHSSEAVGSLREVRWMIGCSMKVFLQL